MAEVDIKDILENSEIFECEAETRYVIYPEGGGFENGLLLGMLLANSDIM